MSRLYASVKPIAFLVLLVLAVACAPASAPTSGTGASPSKKTIAVTYSVLGAVVRDLAGDQANVVVPMPNGQDPHEWEPSAKDIETLNKADLIVQNGLGLEAGMGKTLAQARKSGVRFFTASDYVVVRRVGPDEGLPSGDPDQAAGAEDPHLWMDPLTIKMVVDALAVQLKNDLGIDVADRAKDLDSRLDSLNQELADQIRGLPPANRRLVTGHESLGYFAQRYDFRLVGAIIPNLSSQAQVSASELASLKKQIQENQVKAIFVELGTPPAVATAISNETGVKVVPLTTHSLPSDGSYFTFMRNLTRVVIDGLK